MNERDSLKKAVSRYLDALAPHVFYEKRWGGGVFGKTGVSDFTGCAWGRFFAVEIKHPIKRPALEADQIKYQREVMSAGGFAMPAYSVSDVARLMATLCHFKHRPALLEGPEEVEHEQ